MSTAPAQKLNVRDIIKIEYERSSQDPVHFMKKYCKIEHPKKGKINFNLYPFQEETLAEFKNHRYNIILKSRQTGISTLTGGYSLWNMIFKENYKVLVIATKQAVAKNLVDKVRIMFNNLPSWMTKGLTTEENNKLQLTLSNRSTIKAVAATADAGRSEALSLLIIDEAAFIDKAEEIWTAAQMTLSTGGDCIILSTPNGTGNLFHKLWVQAEDGEVVEDLDRFNPIRIHWSRHPERDQQWRDSQTVLLGERMAAQECVTGDTVITVRNKLTGKIEDISIEALYNRMNGK